MPIPTAEPVSTQALMTELAEPFALTPEQIEFFRQEGFIKIKQVLSPDSLLHLRAELVRLLESGNPYRLDGGIRDRFLSLDMVWLTNALVRQFVLSPRIGKLAADLLGASSVRLYHDNVMSKEPGCGRTPWHNDDHHFPLASNDVVTVWIPLQPTPIAMGPLAFAHPLDTAGLVEDIPFSASDTSYDERVGQTFAREQVNIDEGAFELGEISFHHNQNFHTAGPNHTERSRLVLSNTYFADGARLVKNPTMISGDWQKFAPGVQPGEKLATDVNPICWPAVSC